MGSNSERKFAVRRVRKDDGSDWVTVDFFDGRSWVPSFRDLFRIVEPIATIETEKYPPPQRGGKLVGAFLYDVCAGMPWPELELKYKIPERDVDGRIVRTNGADLTRNDRGLFDDEDRT